MPFPSPSPILTVHPSPTSLLSLLNSHLPRTLVIHRRLQYHLAHPSAYANHHAKVISVFPADAPDPQSYHRHQQNLEDERRQRQERPWLIAHIDVSRLTETTCYIFSSVELNDNDDEGATSSTATNGEKFDREEEAKSQLAVFFTYVRDVLIPQHRPTVAPEGWPFTKQMPGAEKEFRRSVFLMGAVGEEVVRLLREMASGSSTAAATTRVGEDVDEGRRPGRERGEGQEMERGRREDDDDDLQLRIVRCDFPYAKYIFPGAVYEDDTTATSSIAAAVKPIGDGTNHDRYLLPDKDLMFAPLTETSQFNLVISRTHIPRTVQMLSSIPNLGIFANTTTTVDDLNSKEGTEGGAKMPIAWAFLGYDASLSSLHVEPEYRGRGLAQVLAKRLFREAGRFYDVGDRDGEVDGLNKVDWAHADVLETNMGSRRVMEKLGGGMEKIGWRVAWIEVDVGEERR